MHHYHMLNDVLFHPEGYPALGLSGGGLTMAVRPRTVGRVRDAIKLFERQLGNPRFRVVHAHKAHIEIVCEVVRVYAGLRDMYPAVRVDRIDFDGVGVEDSDAHAAAIIYSWAAPTLSYVAQITSLRSPWAVAHAAERMGISPKKVEEEADCISYWEPHANLTCHGGIDLSRRAFASRRAYHTLVTDPDTRADVPAVEVSRVAEAVIHEFGHIADAAVQQMGFEAADHVYRSLSCALGGFDHPRSWRDNLINYPETCNVFVRGPRSRGNASIMRDRWGGRVESQLGWNAVEARTELFAEAFLFAHAGVRSTRRQLSGFRRALKDIGLTEPM